MDIGDILSSLSAEDMQALENIASSISGKAEKTNETTLPQKSSPPTMPQNSTASTGVNLNMDAKMLSDIAGLMSKLGNTSSDPRCHLIEALKPMLSKEKQKRADEAIRIIRLLDLLPTLRNTELLKGVIGG